MAAVRSFLARLMMMLTVFVSQAFCLGCPISKNINKNDNDGDEMTS